MDARGWRRAACCGLASLVAGLVAGCAFDVLHITAHPATLESARSGAGAFQIEDNVKVDLGTGYSRVLRKGTRWEPVGRIAEGDVYQTRDQVLTVEASNVHEAYIVVSSGRLVGFYLPVEKAFAPLPEGMALGTKALP